MTRTLFISDLHLNPDDAHILARFGAFCSTLTADIDAVYILGDLFDFWIGDDAIDQMGHRDAIGLLAGISARQIPLFVMCGNRDFLMGEKFADATGCTLLEDPTPINLYGRKVLLAHGDAYCTDDVEHQRWRLQYQDRDWRRQILNLTVAERFEKARQYRAMSEAGKATKSMHIMDVNHKAIQTALDEHGLNIMIHGHTHRPAVHHQALPHATTSTQPAHHVSGTSKGDASTWDASNGSENISPAPNPGQSDQAIRIVLGDWYEQSSQLTATPEALHLIPTDTWIKKW